MNVVMIIPTGLGCAIGGHSGDATPAARLLGAACDNLILHPNVVNASDINEMPMNAWYVEGSILNRFLAGDCLLSQPKSNKILAISNDLRYSIINGVNSTRSTLGIDITLMKLNTPIEMFAEFNADGTAGGYHLGSDEAFGQINKSGEVFDAIAILTPITMNIDEAHTYFKEGGVNPYGAVEAMLSRVFAEYFCMPVAHAPIELEERADVRLNDVIPDARISSEVIGGHSHSVFKGLSKAPRPIQDTGQYNMSSKNIDCMVSPMCYGRPHMHCESQGIPIIYVRDNYTHNPWVPEPDNIIVANYYEAAGKILAMKAGVEYLAPPELKIIQGA